ncbi:hypothetical protein HanRHA438_Chr14g0630911 [Helianthus annuus]|nr:hypothetical protein HanRHA438_Chr14g0630911 [Helianthus annuus]
MREGTPKNKECAASVLLKLCENNNNNLVVALQYGVYEHVSELSQNGSKRGKKKAVAMLQLMSKSGQIPSYNNVKVPLVWLCIYSCVSYVERSRYTCY